MGDHEPAWLKNNSASAPSPAASAVASSESTSASGKADPPYKKLVTGIWLVVNMGLMVFMAATGALGIGQSTSISDTGIIFVGIYLILFAGIEFIFEISQICPGNMVDNIMKRNFGFLYGNVGKGMFFLFTGILCFGLTEPRTLAIACGVVVAAWGVFTIFIAMKWPEYFETKEKFIP